MLKYGYKLPTLNILEDCSRFMPGENNAEKRINLLYLLGIDTNNSKSILWLQGKDNNGLLSQIDIIKEKIKMILPFFGDNKNITNSKQEALRLSDNKIFYLSKDSIGLFYGVKNV